MKERNIILFLSLFIIVLLICRNNIDKLKSYTLNYLQMNIPASTRLINTKKYNRNLKPKGYTVQLIGGPQPYREKNIKTIEPKFYANEFTTENPVQKTFGDFYKHSEYLSKFKEPPYYEWDYHLPNVNKIQSRKTFYKFYNEDEDFGGRQWPLKPIITSSGGSGSATMGGLSGSYNFPNMPGSGGNTIYLHPFGPQNSRQNQQIQSDNNNNNDGRVENDNKRNNKRNTVEWKPRR